MLLVDKDVLLRLLFFGEVIFSRHNHGVLSSSLFRRKRRGKELDEVSTAIPGGVAAWNKELYNFFLYNSVN